MPMSRRRKNLEEKKSGSPAWMTTFSDLTTLLLTFFVLLYSFSSIDAQKFKNMASALQSVLVGQGGGSILEGDGSSGNMNLEEIQPTPHDKSSSQLNGETKEIYQRVKDFIEKENLGAEVTLRADHRGVIIEIKENILFDSGKVELKPKSMVLLDKLTGLINEFDNEIIVEGHTDNVPIDNKEFPSNWELSVTRATTVVRYFTEEKNVDPKRLSAAGYGEYRPIAPNDVPKNKTLNRRVNILIVTLQGGSENGTTDQ